MLLANLLQSCHILHFIPTWQRLRLSRFTAHEAGVLLRFVRLRLRFFVFSRSGFLAAQVLELSSLLAVNCLSLYTCSNTVDTPCRLPWDIQSLPDQRSLRQYCSRGSFWCPSPREYGWHHLRSTLSVVSGSCLILISSLSAFITCGVDI